MKHSMRLIQVCAIVMLLLTSFVSADLAQDIEAMSSKIEGKSLPGPVGTLFGNERVNLYLDLDSGDTLVLGLATKDKVVESVSTAPLENPTVKVYTSEAALREVSESKDPLAALRGAMKEEKVTYEAVGFWKKIKFGFISLFTGFSAHQEEAADNAVTVKEEEGEVEAADQEYEEELAEENEGEESEQEASEESEDTQEEVGDSLTGAVAAEPQGSVTHTVYMTNDGFDPVELTIVVGDTVKWEMSRAGTYSKGLVVGAQKCSKVRSQVFSTGETFEWTFDEPVKCPIVDGVLTTKLMDLVVE